MTAAAPSTLGRAFDLYRRTSTERSAVALIVANAIPLIGVLFFGWSLLTILVLFWLENGIVGFWNIPRILLARGSIVRTLPDMSEQAAFDATGNAVAAAELQARWRRAQAALAASGTAGDQAASNPIAGALLGTGGLGRGVMAFWFLIHYGIFWLAHGFFVFALPSFVGFGARRCFDEGLPAGLPPDFGPVCASPFGDVVWSNVAIAAVALFVSHGASFFLNYIGKREYLTTSAMRQMFAPYGRVVILHLTIIFGAFAIAIIGAPIGALVVLVVLKTAFDLGLHLREHGSPVAPPQGTQPTSAAAST
jgi:hypothetical protein